MHGEIKQAALYARNPEASRLFDQFPNKRIGGMETLRAQ